MKGCVGFLVLSLGLAGSSLHAAQVGTTPAGSRVTVPAATSFVPVAKVSRVVAAPAKDRFLLLNGVSVFAKEIGCQSGSPVRLRKGIACPSSVPTLSYVYLGVAASVSDERLAAGRFLEIRSPGQRIEQCGMTKAARSAMAEARVALEVELGFAEIEGGPRRWLEVGFPQGKHFLASLPAAAFPELRGREPLRAKMGGPCDCYGEGRCTVHDMIDPATGRVDETFCGEDACDSGCHLNMD